MAVGGHALVEFGDEAVAHPGAGGLGDVLIARHVPGDVVLEIAAVGDVVVDVEVGIPGVEESEPGAHLRRVGLDVVAVQVHALGVGAEAGGFGAVLAGPVVGAEIFVAIDVEDRDDDEDHVIQPGGVFLADHHVADQHERGVLAFDLSGVNAALDEHDDLAGLSGGLGRERAVLGHDEGDHGAALGRGADGLHFDEARGSLQAVRDLDGFGVGRGLVPIGFLAGGQEVGRRCLGAGGERGGCLGGRRLDRGMRGDGILGEDYGRSNGEECKGSEHVEGYLSALGFALALEYTR